MTLQGKRIVITGRRLETYRSLSRIWEWPIALTIQADASAGLPAARSIYRDLWHGACRGAHASATAALERAAFVVSGDPRTWKHVYAHELEPVAGRVRGQLTLAKGHMILLIRYAAAARELVMLATQVETRFPAALS